MLLGWLAPLYAIPVETLRVIGAVNLLYGTASGALWLTHPQPLEPWLRRLAVANMVWGVGCLIAGGIAIGEASPFGLAQLFGEGVFVGGLGVIEWRAAGAAMRGLTSTR